MNCIGKSLVCYLQIVLYYLCRTSDVGVFSYQEQITVQHKVPDLIFIYDCCMFSYFRVYLYFHMLYICFTVLYLLCVCIYIISKNLFLEKVENALR